MRKVAPSVLRREELDQLLQAGAAPGDNIISELVSTVTRLVVQELGLDPPPATKTSNNKENVAA